jgi:hypothetical protein
MALQKKEFMSKTGREINARQYDIVISNGIWEVYGKMKNNFSYQLQGKWADLFNGLIPGAEFLMKTGDASLTAGIFSRKYFQGGNNLQLTTEFRIYDDGITDVNPIVYASKNLASMTVSNAPGKGTGEVAYQKFRNLFTRAKTLGEKIISNDKNVNLISEATGILKEFSSTNRTVRLKIGNFFRCNTMIIESINVTYSKELTFTGPLYGDFSVSFLSLEAIVRGLGNYGIDSILDVPQFKITVDGEDVREQQ